MMSHNVEPELILQLHNIIYENSHKVFPTADNWKIIFPGMPKISLNGVSKTNAGNESSLFGHSNQCGSNCSPTQLISNLLNVQHCVKLNIGVGDLEEGLVLVRVKLFVEGIDGLKPVTLKHLQQLIFGQLQALKHTTKRASVHQGWTSPK